MPIHELKEQIARLPEQPGVYLYFNAEGETIYVGKARALRVTHPETADAESRDASPLQRLERKEIRERFGAALAALPPRQRLIVSMFEVDGLSTSEIGDTLGISQETVRWHLHQARRVLREALAVLRG